MKNALRVALPLMVAAVQCAVCQNQTFSVAVSGAGKPMILIPGLECSGAVWDAVAARYKDRYQLHVLTLAGFAGQPAVPGLRLATVRDDVIRYIRKNRLDHPVIVGHSLGGFLALWIAATDPDLPGSIVSVDGAPFLPALFNPSATVDEGREAADNMRKMYASLGPPQLDAMARMALTQMISEAKNIEMVAGWATKSDGAFVGQAVYDLMTTDLRAEMARVRVPVLLIAAGKALGPATRSAYEPQVEKIPKHKVLVAADALHFVMYDDPTFLMAAMDGFLAEGDSHAR